MIFKNIFWKVSLLVEKCTSEINADFFFIRKTYFFTHFSHQNLNLLNAPIKYLQMLSKHSQDLLDWRATKLNTLNLFEYPALDAPVGYSNFRQNQDYDLIFLKIFHFLVFL